MTHNDLIKAVLAEAGPLTPLQIGSRLARAGHRVLPNRVRQLLSIGIPSVVSVGNGLWTVSTQELPVCPRCGSRSPPVTQGNIDWSICLDCGRTS